MKRVGIDVTAEEHRDIKMVATKNNKTIKDFCLEVIRDRVKEGLCSPTKQKNSSI